MNKERRTDVFTVVIDSLICPAGLAGDSLSLTLCESLGGPPSAVPVSFAPLLKLCFGCVVLSRALIESRRCH